ncbi:hypothetical protein KI429_06010 [Pseudomonas shirazica]|nr:hypothetical protein KI429_06010 [Pseudomonas shirazica]
MNPHSVAVSAIEAAIETMLLPGSGPVEDAKAETMVVAYFSILDPRHRLQRVQTFTASAFGVLPFGARRLHDNATDHHAH